MFASIIQVAAMVFGSAVAISMALTVLHYPYDADRDDESDTDAKSYYNTAYETMRSEELARPFATDEEYVFKAREHAAAAGVPADVQAFIEGCGLQAGRALEVGAGSGFLQDIVHHYFAMDVSATAGRFFHRPFVEASATRIPFRDDAFDAVWSIWVLEHVSNPERALTEIRRVVKDGGYILLRPAWSCDSWAAGGYEVRPYSDFGLKGKLIKATVPIRMSRLYSLCYARQIRLIRAMVTALSSQPARLHFTRLKPNYSKYWTTDSDAVVSLDWFEVFLWFTSRGDTCINAPSRNALLFGRQSERRDSLIIRVNKASTGASRDQETRASKSL